MRRVLIAGFKHETNTFSKMGADLAAYRARALIYGENIRDTYRDTNTEIAGFLDACKRHGWQAIPAVVADATPSGRVTAQAFDEIAGHILKTIDTAAPLDAMLLQLHGAMVTENHEDGESALLSLIRDKVGPNLPIGVTHDLHANITDLTASLADVLVSYRSYPHIDMHETATRCADLIARKLAGEIDPQVTVRRNSQLDGVDHGRTTAPGPMLRLLALARQLETRHDLLSISINAGFPWADVSYVGPSIIIVASKDNDQVGIASQSLAAEIWNSRNELTIKPVSAIEAIAEALQTAKPGAPFVIADFADNPGGGGYGDSTGLLRAMIKSDLRDAAFSALYDPASVAACVEVGLGNEIELLLGGKSDPALSPPIATTGKVISLHGGAFKLQGPMSTGVTVDLGQVAIFRTAGVDIVLASNRLQNYDCQFFRAFDIEPKERSILAVKSAQHFRADYAPLASGIAIVDEGDGITSRNFQALNYTKVRRPIWPLDEVPAQAQ